MFTRAPIGIALADSDCRFVDANEAFCRMLGYTRSELGEMSVFDIMHPEERIELAARKHAVVIEGLSGYETERRYVRRNGVVIWAHVVTGAVKDHEGKHLCGMAMVWDITERKRTEETLQSSTARLRSVFDSSPLAITVTDLDGHIMDCSRAALDTYGLDSTAEVLGKSVFDFVAIKDRADAATAMAELLHHGSIRDREYTLVKKADRHGPP